MGEALGVMRELSTREQGRQSLLRGCAMFEQTMGLDVTGGNLETGRALIKVVVDVDVTKLPALKVGFMIMEVVMSKGHIMITASPPDFDVGHGGFFFFGQG